MTDRASSSGTVSIVPDGVPVDVDLVDRIVAEFESIPGVVGLSAGPVGTASTMLSGRRVAGLRVDDEHVEVHIAVEWNVVFADVGRAVQSRIQKVSGRRVDVIIEDVFTPSEIEQTSGER